jgi:hypothetical protein
MWLLLDRGFISIVEHQDDPSVLQVRSRVKADISNIFPNADVYEHDGADYLFRANISREEVANIMWEKVMTLDYTSHVKDVAIQRSAPAQGRSAAYYATWTAMSKMQPVPPYHSKYQGKSKWYDRDEAWGQGRLFTTTPSKPATTPSVASLATMGVKVDEKKNTTTTKVAGLDEPVAKQVTKQDIDAKYEPPVDTAKPVVEWADAVCQESFDDPAATCSECGHTAIVHPGLNDIEGCVLCEIDHAYFDYEDEEKN